MNMIYMMLRSHPVHLVNPVKVFLFVSLFRKLFSGEFFGDAIGAVDFHQGFHDSVDVR